jgi:translation initiation factor 1 (eIF-1/SUI1)
MLNDYVTKNQLQDGRQKTHVRLNDTILVSALFPKVASADVPGTMPRDALVDKLIAVSCQEHHRVSRLKPARALRAEKINLEGGADMELEAGEVRGPMRKGGPSPIHIEVKQRQGKKVVTLVTGLESFGIEPKDLAGECKRKMGASSSGEWPSQSRMAHSLTRASQSRRCPRARQRTRSSRCSSRATSARASARS